MNYAAEDWKGLVDELNTIRLILKLGFLTVNQPSLNNAGKIHTLFGSAAWLKEYLAIWSRAGGWVGSDQPNMGQS